MEDILWGVLRPLRAKNTSAWSADHDQVLKALEGAVGALQGDLTDVGEDLIQAAAYVVELRLCLEEAALDSLDPRVVEALSELDEALASSSAALLVDEEEWQGIVEGWPVLPGFLAVWAKKREAPAMSFGTWQAFQVLAREG